MSQSCNATSCDYRSDRELLAIQYAIDNGADVINLSYGTPITSAMIQSNLDHLKQILAEAEKRCWLLSQQEIIKSATMMWNVSRQC